MTENIYTPSTPNANVMPQAAVPQNVSSAPVSEYVPPQPLFRSQAKRYKHRMEKRDILLTLFSVGLAIAWIIVLMN